MPDKAELTTSRRPARAAGSKKVAHRQHKDSKAAVEQAVIDGSMPRRALRLNEVAVTLGISRWHLNKLIEGGEIGTVRLGSLRVVPTSEIDRLLSARLERQEAEK